MWKSIDGYEGYYEVSDSGEVRSMERYVLNNGHFHHVKEKIMKLTNNKGRDGNGYLVVNLRKENTTKIVPVHILVAKAFLTNDNNHPTVNHINGKKTDNRVTNLEWASYKENNEHALKTHLRKPRGNYTAQYSKDCNLIAIFKSTTEASRITGIGRGAISLCVNNRTNTAGGYIWRKVTEGATTIPQGSRAEIGTARSA